MAARGRNRHDEPVACRRVERRDDHSLGPRGRLHPCSARSSPWDAATTGPRARMRAAALACPGAAISHRSAARCSDRQGRARGRRPDPDRARGRQIDGISLTGCRIRRRRNSSEFEGFPARVARTIVDLAGTYGDERVAGVGRAGGEARSSIWRRWMRCSPMGHAARGPLPAPGSRGLATGRRVRELRGRCGASSRSSSSPCRRGRSADAAGSMRRSATGDRVLEVDLLWDPERFVVEADSRRHHAIEVAFERDRKRDRELMAAASGSCGSPGARSSANPRAVFAVLAARAASVVPRGAPISEHLGRPSPPQLASEVEEESSPCPSSEASRPELVDLQRPRRRRALPAFRPPSSQRAEADPPQAHDPVAHRLDHPPHLAVAAFAQDDLDLGLADPLDPRRRGRAVLELDPVAQAPSSPSSAACARSAR